LAHQPDDNPEVLAARRAMETDPKLISLRQEASQWPGTVLSSHKSANQTFHKMVFLADLGFDESDPWVARGVKAMRAARDGQGLIPLPVKPRPGESSDVIRSGWALCDAPVLLYILGKMSRVGWSEVLQGAQTIASYTESFGVPCIVSLAHGGFRGPGKKTDPCPYATLVSLKLWQCFPELTDSSVAQTARETLLSLWEHSREKHPYMFFMGTDFRKLTAPFVWYDLLHVAEVLSWDVGVRRDPRFLDMMATIRAKADSRGFYAPEQSARAWAGWEFGSVAVPSLWLTFLVERIERRLREPQTGEETP
jgi:hypothetical protein